MKAEGVVAGRWRVSISGRGNSMCEVSEAVKAWYVFEAGVTEYVTALNLGPGTQQPLGKAASFI